MTKYKCFKIKENFENVYTLTLVPSSEKQINGTSQIVVIDDNIFPRSTSYGKIYINGPAVPFNATYTDTWSFGKSSTGGYNVIFINLSNGLDTGISAGKCYNSNSCSNYSFTYTLPRPVPTTQAPTTQAPTTQVPTTQVPTTQVPTTQVPTTQAPTIVALTTEAVTTQALTTEAVTTQALTTQVLTTAVPTVEVTTPVATTTSVLTTPITIPITIPSATEAITTLAPSTVIPTSEPINKTYIYIIIGSVVFVFIVIVMIVIFTTNQDEYNY